MAVRQSPGIVLIWVYYTSQIILMGTEVTHSYVKHNGSLKRRGGPHRLLGQRRPSDLTPRAGGNLASLELAEW